MWSRQELKERGRIAFKRNYWKCVIVALILVLFTSSGSRSSNNQNNTNNGNGNNITYTYDDLLQDQQELQEDMNEIASGALNQGVGLQQGVTGILGRFLPAGVSTILSGVFVGVAGLMLLIIALGVVLFNIVISNVLAVGGCRFFLKNSYNPTKVGEILWGFRDGKYVNIVVTQFLRALFTALWSLLLIIPGIIKSYEYRMIPFILAENPDIPWRDAFAKSKQMMEGQKMDAFILDLSFFGWNFLAALTWGLTGIFYSNPYKYATDAQLYLTLNGGFEDSDSDTFGGSYQDSWQQAYDQGIDWEKVGRYPDLDERDFSIGQN